MRIVCGQLRCVTGALWCRCVWICAHAHVSCMMVILCFNVNVSIMSRVPSLMSSNYILPMHTVHPHAKTDRRKRSGRRHITSDGINGPRSAQDRRIQQAHIHHAHGNLLERREMCGMCTTRAHSAGVRAAAELAAAARTASPRAAMRPRRPLDARARRGLDERLDAASGLLGGRRAARHACRHST